MMRQLTTYLLSPIAAFAFLSGGTLTTLMGPFGTYTSMTLLERAAYWYTLVGLSLVISLILRRYVDLTFADRGFWFRASLTGVTFATLFTPCIYGMNWLINGSEGMYLMPFWMIYLIVLSVPATVNPFIYFVTGRDGRDFHVAPEDTAGLSAPARPKLLERLPDDLGHELLRVSVQDHFVHVYMAGGAEKLRMRFGDALSEVEGVPGLQVHRSHWVAKEAVAGHDQNGGRIFLKLKDGSSVPVSRNFRADVEAAGLLANPGGQPSGVADRQERQSA